MLKAREVEQKTIKSEQEGGWGTEGAKRRVCSVLACVWITNGNRKARDRESV